MTANAMQGDREICLRAGMDDYISKPIRVGELVRVLRECPVRSAQRSQAAAGVSLEEVIDLEALQSLPQMSQEPSANLLQPTIGSYLVEAAELVRAIALAVTNRDAAPLYQAAWTLFKVDQYHCGCLASRRALSRARSHWLPGNPRGSSRFATPLGLGISES